MSRRRSRDLVVLYPGAGSGADHPGLVAVETALRPIPVRRVDFEYRRRGRRAPDRAPRLMAEIRTGLDHLEATRVVLGGRSMGGRIASMVVAGADGALPPSTVVGLVLIAYPLHPPGRPDRLRIEHFDAISVPCCFVSGTRDPFGSPAELERYTATIPAPVEHHWIDGARHELRDAEGAVAEAVAGFVRRVLTP